MMKIELGIGAPLVDRSRNGVETRTMSASEVRKARRPLAGATSIKTKSGFVRAGVYFCSGITFAVLIYICDTAARTLFSPYEIPVGIIMAFLGAPFFVFILIKGKGGHGDA